MGTLWNIYVCMYFHDHNRDTPTHIKQRLSGNLTPSFKCPTVQSCCSNICNILVYYCVIRANSLKDKQGQSLWQRKQCTLNYRQRKHRIFYFTKLSDWMKVVKTKPCCHERASNLLKAKMEPRALGFIWHIYWISFVCISGLYTGSSTPHHSASVELLSPNPNPGSATDLPSRQHRLERDLGSPHHLSPLTAMDNTRDGWVLHGRVI